MTMEGDMAERVARQVDDVECQSQRRDFDTVAFAHPIAGIGNALVVRREARNVETATQFGHAAGVIGMMMGKQDRDRPQAVFSGRQYRGGVARIDDQRPAVGGR